MKHWILTRATMQTIITQLDAGHITLKYAKNFYGAYGVSIEGRTKKVFIKNLIKATKENDPYLELEYIMIKLTEENTLLINTAQQLLEALQQLKEAVEYTPLGIRGIKAVENAKLVIDKAEAIPELNTNKWNTL